MEQVIDKVFTIGRSKENDFELPMQQISGYHASIRCLSENSFIVEDNNSSNGSFLNGLQIKRVVCNRNDRLFFADYQFSFDTYFPLTRLKKEIQEKFNIPPDVKLAASQKSNANDYSQEFAELESIYKLYNESKLSIQGKGQLKGNLIRTAPGVALSLTLAALGFGALSFVGCSFGSMLGVMMSGNTNGQEKLLALDDEFKINYACPKCRNFLGYIPWKSLASKKTCDRCKATWVK